MTIKQIEVTVGDIARGYINSEEQGVRGYGGQLDIRPPYQREFIYNENEQQAVISTVLKGYPLNVMYWVRRSEDAECPYEVMDGQQRTLSLCEYVDGKFAYDFKNFFNQPADIQKLILDYPLTIYLCEGEPSEKLEWFKTINIAGKPLNEQEINSHPLKTIFQHKACTNKLYADSFYKVQKNSHSSFEVICCRS